MSNRDDLLAPVVGVGHPNFQADLSEADQRKIDEKGRPVVLGEPWSEAATDLWLTVFVPAMKHIFLTAEGRLGADRTVRGQALGLPDGRSLGLFVSLGKPTFSLPGYGASLELPSDLARDELKVRYVTEWFLDTTKESVSAAGGNLEHLKAIAGEAVLVVEKAIREAGL